jgi:hypothetical protein
MPEAARWAASFYMHDQLFAPCGIRSIFVSVLLKKEAVTALPHAAIARKHRS